MSEQKKLTDSQKRHIKTIQEEKLKAVQIIALVTSNERYDFNGFKPNGSLSFYDNEMGDNFNFSETWTIGMITTWLEKRAKNYAQNYGRAILENEIKSVVKLFSGIIK